MSKGDYGEPLDVIGEAELRSCSAEWLIPLHVDDDLACRIATCVNALDGVEDPAAELERLREIERVARELKRAWNEATFHEVEDTSPERSELFNLLDKDGE